MHTTPPPCRLCTQEPPRATKSHHQHAVTQSRDVGVGATDAFVNESRVGGVKADPPPRSSSCSLSPEQAAGGASGGSRHSRPREATVPTRRTTLSSPPRRRVILQRLCSTPRSARQCAPKPTSRGLRREPPPRVSDWRAAASLHSDVGSSWTPGMGVHALAPKPSISARSTACLHGRRPDCAEGTLNLPTV